MATYSAHAVAAEIRTRLPGVPVKKLHKLLYYCQAHHAATFGQGLFTETISAWDMGPVVGQLWWEEKQGTIVADLGSDAFTEAELNTIGYVISRYGKLSGSDLERLTHSEAPWSDADAERKRLGETSHKIAVDSLIQFFRSESSASSAGDSEDSVTPPLNESEVQAWLKGAADRYVADASNDTTESLLARLG